MKNAPRFLAVYGSLLEGVSAPEPPAGIRDNLLKMDTIFLSGDLYVVSGEKYPGFIPRVNGPQIEAELYLVTKDDVFTALDEWEEATGEPDAPYRRQMMSVYNNGQSVTFWVYVGNHDMSLRRPIAETSWRDYFNAHFTAEATG